MLEFGASILDGEWPNRPWPRSASVGWHEAPRIYDARCGRAGGLRVASTLRLPRFLHRSRFTNVAIGVSGMMARRDSPAPVNTPTCRQLRHSTVTVGSARNARSDIPEKIGRLLPLSESTHSGQRQDSTRRACKAADKDAPLLHQQVRRSFVLATPHTPVSTSAAFAQPRSAILCQCQSGTGYGFGPVSISVKRT